MSSTPDHPELTGPASAGSAASPAAPISDDNYRSLAAFRYALRQFLVFSEGAANAAGLMPQQHQALLAIKYLSLEGRPSVGDIAERLMLRHHSVVELISRLARMGLVKRMPDAQDRRRVRVVLTPLAEEKLAGLSAVHLAELRSIRPMLGRLLQQFSD